MAGGLVMAAARRRGVAVLPVDSEHNAIHQCLHGRSPGEVRRLLLTASGGPFRGWAAERLDGVRPADAPRPPDLAHGPQDHRRLGDVDEQGPRGHRGPVAVRHAGRPHRRGRAPAVGGAFAGRAPRRVGDRPDGGHRHAAAHPVRVLVPRPVGQPPAAARSRRLRPPRVRPAGPRTVPVPGARLPGVARRAGPARRPQRRQRGRGRGVPRRAARVHRDSRRHRGGPRRRGGGVGPRRPSTRCGACTGAPSGIPAAASPSYNRNDDHSPRVPVRPRGARLRARAGAFPRRPASRRPCPDVLARLRAEDPADEAGRHGLLRQRHPPGRLREDGRRDRGRQARGPGRRVPVEDEVAALPGPDRGTRDERRARGGGHDRRAPAGGPGAALRGGAAGHRVGGRGLPRGRRGHSPRRPHPDRGGGGPSTRGKSWCSPSWSVRTARSRCRCGATARFGSCG